MTGTEQAESVKHRLIYEPIEITQLSPLPDDEIRAMAIQAWIEILAVAFGIPAEWLEKVEDERRETYKANPSCNEFSSSILHTEYHSNDIEVDVIAYRVS